MIRTLLVPTALALAVYASPASATAIVTIFDDRDEFAAFTHATSPGDLPDSHLATPSLMLGTLTITATPPSTLATYNNGVDDWSARIPGTDLALNGVESFTLTSAKRLTSLGFDMVEPRNDSNVNAAFQESIFEIKIFLGKRPLFSFRLSKPNDSLEFVGLHSSMPFNRVEMREVRGEIENEFFGNFLVGSGPLTPSP